MRARRMSGKEKAAVLLVSLGPELSASIFKHLKEDEIEELTLAIAGLKRIQPEVRDEVMEEFRDLLVAREYLEQGGIEYARELLEKALGKDRADDIIKRLTASLTVRPFDFARKTDPGQLLNFIQNEHPQTIALILAYLHPEQAVIGKEDGEIAGVVAVGLLIGVPVSSCGEEGVVWIANAAVSIHMHMKAMGADWISAGRGRLVGGESGHLY
jgi:flagellar motor switch protein FliG